MDLYSVLGLMCVVSGCSIFLGHASGYYRGKRVGRRQAFRDMRTTIVNSFDRIEP